MKITKSQLRKTIRKVLKESNDVNGERIKPPQNKSQAEDLLHDTLLAVEQYLSLEEIEAIFAQLY